MSDANRKDDPHVEPLYAAVKPAKTFTSGPSLGVRLVFVAAVVLALLWLVLKQAY